MALLILGIGATLYFWVSRKSSRISAQSESTTLTDAGPGIELSSAHQNSNPEAPFALVTDVLQTDSGGEMKIYRWPRTWHMQMTPKQ